MRQNNTTSPGATAASPSKDEETRFQRRCAFMRDLRSGRLPLQDGEELTIEIDRLAKLNRAEFIRAVR